MIVNYVCEHMLANELIIKKTIPQRTMEYSDLRILSDGVENFTLKNSPHWPHWIAIIYLYNTTTPTDKY